MNIKEKFDQKTTRRIFLFVATVFLAIALFWGGSTLVFSLTAHESEGDVLELHESIRRKKGKKKISYRPVVEFKAQDGSLHRFTSNVGTNPPSYEVGDKVIVLYDPQNPEKALIDGLLSKYLGSLVFGLLGGFFLYLGIGSKPKSP